MTYAEEMEAINGLLSSAMDVLTEQQCLSPFTYELDTCGTKVSLRWRKAADHYAFFDEHGQALLSMGAPVRIQAAANMRDIFAAAHAARDLALRNAWAARFSLAVFLDEQRKTLAGPTSD